jgi:acyl-CoA thioester hydrolase
LAAAHAPRYKPAQVRTGTAFMFIETWRGVVTPAQCDHLGHMNVQYYFAAAGEGMFTISGRLGLTRKAIEERRMCFVVVHAVSDFRRELRACDSTTLLSTIEEMGDKMGVFKHKLVRNDDEAVAFELWMKAVLLHLDTRKACEIPQDLRAAAAPFVEANAG